jgi:DNA-binding transcriptional LysR family regulator
MPWNDRTKRRLKLRDLDILMAVIETGSMGKAASRLGISQPAVSKAMVELETALGVKLVDRSRRGVAPTLYGLALGKRSIAIFNDLRQGVQDIDFLSDPTTGEIRIGTTEPVAMAIVLPAIDRLVRQYPRMFFHVVAGDTGTLYRELTERNVELAVSRIIGRLPDELSAEILFHDSFAVVTAATNPLTRRRKLTLAELANEPWTLYPFDSFFGSMIADAFRASGHELPRLTVSTLSTNVQNDARDRAVPHRASGLHAQGSRQKSAAESIARDIAQRADADRDHHLEESDPHSARAALCRQRACHREAAGETEIALRGEPPGRFGLAASGRSFRP